MVVATVTHKRRVLIVTIHVLAPLASAAKKILSASI